MKYETLIVYVRSDDTRIAVYKEPWSTLQNASLDLTEKVYYAQRNGTKLIFAAVQSLDDA